MSEEFRELRDCFLSGQMSYAQWKAHCRDTPGLQQWVEEELRMTVQESDQATAPPAPHVIRAMSAVTARLAEAGVSKSRNNSQQNYKFRGIDEIMNAMAPIIASERLVIVPHVQSRELTERQAKSGMVLFSVVVSVAYTFVSAEDGSREVVGPFHGEAMDTADKATNKAMSAAYKYMAIQTFCIPT